MGLWERDHKVVVRNLWRKVRLETTKQARGYTNRVKVLSRQRSSKRPAVPQGLCANLVDALKLLANQQEDGDGLLQNIVTNLGKESRKGLTTVCVNSSGLIMVAPWMLERYAEARELLKFGSRKFRKGART